jgi:hypothetical protein
LNRKASFAISYFVRGSVTSVADPHRLGLDTDPDPACHFDVDPDPALSLDADPDPTFHFDADADSDPCCQIKT